MKLENTSQKASLQVFKAHQHISPAMENQCQAQKPFF